MRRRSISLFCLFNSSCVRVGFVFWIHNTNNTVWSYFVLFFYISQKIFTHTDHRWFKWFEILNVSWKIEKRNIFNDWMKRSWKFECLWLWLRGSRDHLNRLGHRVREGNTISFVDFWRKKRQKKKEKVFLLVCLFFMCRSNWNY